MIHFDSLHVTFAAGTPLKKKVFEGLSLTIPAGEFVTVIGSNGAGKSTLLNVLSGDVIPGKGLQSGRVIVGDRDVTSWPVARRARLISRVFQNPLAGSCANLTLEENMVLAQRRSQPLTLRPALNRKQRQQFRDRLSTLELGLENRLSDRMGLLSGGQRQAASLVMATLAPTQVLLLDEHTAALDPKTAAYILKLTKSLIAEQQLTTLMVTHSMQQALELGDRILMLHEGNVALDISGPQHDNLTVNDLLKAFATARPQTGNHQAITDDALLLG